MKWNILNQPLGSVCSAGYTTKKEIPLAIPIAMAGASLFSSIFGGSQSAKANEEAQQQLQAERTRTEAERMRAKNQRWLDTASGQNTMRAVRDMADREYKRISGAAAVGGATEAENWQTSSRPRLSRRQMQPLRIRRRPLMLHIVSSFQASTSNRLQPNKPREMQ